MERLQRQVLIKFEGKWRIIQFHTKEVNYLVGPAILSFVAGLAGIRYSQPGFYSMRLTNAAYDEKEYSASIADEEVWLSTGAEEEVKNKFYALEYGSKRSYRIDLYTFSIQYYGPTPNAVGDGKWRKSVMFLKGITVGVEISKRSRASTVIALRWLESGSRC